MAGHSKWANIKHKKARADAKKGKVFSRIAKEIISAVKIGGPDPKTNPRMRLVLQKAKSENVPNEIIERNIKKATEADQADFTEMTYEMYGHGGVGIICDIMTDNKNRLASEMRIAANKKGGSIASPGSVAYNFDRKGVIQMSSDHAIEEELFNAAIESGAEGFEKEQDVFVITTDPTMLFEVKEGIEALGFKCDEASLEMIPKNMIECDLETAQANLGLIEWLEGIDDVDAVYHNMMIPDALQ